MTLDAPCGDAGSFSPNMGREQRARTARIGITRHRAWLPVVDRVTRVAQRPQFCKKWRPITRGSNKDEPGLNHLGAYRKAVGIKPVALVLLLREHLRVALRIEIPDYVYAIASV